MKNYLVFLSRAGMKRGLGGTGVCSCAYKERGLRGTPGRDNRKCLTVLALLLMITWVWMRPE